ncbi:chorion class B protein Ld34-like [Epargyreus clarus]|uniref:chorion class B protein Ld34-like n=1 Tax=Epargyreus clarus TaxID=520877 RepID=UPI003C2E1925
MSLKIVLAVCAQALLIQSIAAQCIGAPFAGAPFVAAPLAAAPCAAAWYDAPYAAAPLAGWAYGPAGALAASNGPGLAISSASPLIPAGVSVLSENAYEGTLAVGGALPFLGTVAIEGALPTAGAGAVAYGCGNGAVAITAEDAGAYGFAGLAGPLGYGAYGLAGPLGYGPGCGCGCGAIY